jgi:hypothetical protein
VTDALVECVADDVGDDTVEVGGGFAAPPDVHALSAVSAATATMIPAARPARVVDAIMGRA